MGEQEWGEYVCVSIVMVGGGGVTESRGEARQQLGRGKGKNVVRNMRRGRGRWP